MERRQRHGRRGRHDGHRVRGVPKKSKARTSCSRSCARPAGLTGRCRDRADATHRHSRALSRLVRPRRVAASRETPPSRDRPAKPAKADEAAEAPKAAKDSGDGLAVLSSETPLAVTLTTNIKRIRGDKYARRRRGARRRGYTRPRHRHGHDSVKIKTRGIWRLKNCEFPPIRLNFTSEAVKGTAFRGLDQPKLVNYCRNNDEYEQYVLQELQLYRDLRLLTPASHAVRLVR